MSAIVQYLDHSLVLPFLGIGMKTDLLQSCGHCWVCQICWCIESSTLVASCLRIWNSSTGIPSPPLALFVVMEMNICLPWKRTEIILLFLTLSEYCILLYCIQVLHIIGNNINETFSVAWKFSLKPKGWEQNTISKQTSEREVLKISMQYLLTNSKISPGTTTPPKLLKTKDLRQNSLKENDKSRSNYIFILLLHSDKT